MPFDVECFDRPRHNVERVSAPDRVRCTRSDCFGGPRPRIWTNRDDNCVLRFVEANTLDNTARQPTRTSSYTVDLHPVLLPVVPSR